MHGLDAGAPYHKKLSRRGCLRLSVVTAPLDPLYSAQKGIRRVACIVMMCTERCVACIWDAGFLLKATHIARSVVAARRTARYQCCLTRPRSTFLLQSFLHAKRFILQSHFLRVLIVKRYRSTFESNREGWCLNNVRAPAPWWRTVSNVINVPQ